MSFFWQTLYAWRVLAPGPRTSIWSDVLRSMRMYCGKWTIWTNLSQNSSFHLWSGWNNFQVDPVASKQLLKTWRMLQKKRIKTSEIFVHSSVLLVCICTQIDFLSRSLFPSTMKSSRQRWWLHTHLIYHINFLISLRFSGQGRQTCSRA